MTISENDEIHCTEESNGVQQVERIPTSLICEEEEKTELLGRIE